MSSTVSDIAVKTIKGEQKQLQDYAGNVLLIVNVASYCGYRKNGSKAPSF
jgi:glutathione peroxidase